MNTDDKKFIGKSADGIADPKCAKYEQQMVLKKQS